MTPTEAQECKTFIQWCNLHKKLRGCVIHIPNEAKRSIQGHAEQKRMGLIKGASDYFIAIPTKYYHGLFLEMKRAIKNAKVSKHQETFIAHMKQNGYHGVIAYGFDEAMKIVQNYINDYKFPDDE